MVSIGEFIGVMVLGIDSGLTLALITVGLTLIFGLMGVINFAHGSIFMLGAYFGLSLVPIFGNYWVALVLATIGVAIIAGLIEVFLLRPLYDRDPLTQILLTFGLVVLIQGLIHEIWGGNVRNIAAPESLSGSMTIGTITYPNFRLFVMGISAVIILALWIFLVKTNIGATMRASAEDSDMVNMLGIDTAKIFTGMFVFGSALAAFAGVLVGTVRSVHPGMGLAVIVQAFAIIVIGGLGSYRGAVIGSLMVGILQTQVGYYAPGFGNVAVFALMIFVLLTKPTGLFGDPESL